eukprot:516970-Pleurochrysis_carterae.AAC.1
MQAEIRDEHNYELTTTLFSLMRVWLPRAGVRSMWSNVAALLTIVDCSSCWWRCDGSTYQQLHEFTTAVPERACRS